jgi:hypothetical protein
MTAQTHNMAKASATLIGATVGIGLGAGRLLKTLRSWSAPLSTQGRACARDVPIAASQHAAVSAINRGCIEATRYLPLTSAAAKTNGMHDLVIGYW